jgi:hypothetical protein
MASNLYHVLSFMPAVEGWEMPKALENLAQQIVISGKLRINADHERNFVRFGDATYSFRELTDPSLKPLTQKRLKRHIAPAAASFGFDNLWQQLTTEMKKARGVSIEKEMRVARLLVQSAEPAVIQLLIRSGTEIFVSYSHNVSDLVPLHEWQTNGTAGGLQATDSDATAVYVSCGGDPFFEGEQKTYTTDGFPALARMVVIAGQELGHFADLRRSARGIIGRYSTDINASQLRADPTARRAWEADQQQVRALENAYESAGLGALRHAESRLAFYHARRRYSPPWLFYQLWRCIAWLRLIINATQSRLSISFKILPRHKLGESIALYLSDMAFNLTPDADDYKHPDPLIEEAILVLEAVARVPQQANKWQHRNIMQAWPNLYQFYYGTIITSCAGSVGTPLPTPSLPWWQRFAIRLHRAVRQKPGYYP